MPIWKLEFYPQKGENNSPYDYIIGLDIEADRAAIALRLKFMRENNIGDWPKAWVHKIIDKIFQLTARDHRLLYFLHQNTIVVIHAFRKGSQKTKKIDIHRAEIHYKNYLNRKG